MFAILLWIEIHVEANSIPFAEIKIILHNYKREYKILSLQSFVFQISVHFVVIIFVWINLLSRMQWEFGGINYSSLYLVSHTCPTINRCNAFNKYAGFHREQSQNCCLNCTVSGRAKFLAKETGATWGWKISQHFSNHTGLYSLLPPSEGTFL